MKSNDKRKKTKAEYTKEWKKKNREKTKAQLKRHRETHSKERRFYCSMYKCKKINRLPKWITKQDIERMKQFYINCPDDMTVDHIYPLKGTHCSGFHHPDNLQYLTIEDNQKKFRSLPENLT